MSQYDSNHCTSCGNCSADITQLDIHEIGKLLLRLEQQLFRIREQNGYVRKDSVPIRNVVADTFNQLKQRYEKQGAITGLATGFGDLDHLTCGLQKADLIVLAAAPAMGKRSMAMNMAESVALKSKKAVAIYSMEISAPQLGFSLLSSIGRVKAQRLRTGVLEDEDWARVNTAIRTLADTKIFIDDSSELSASELVLSARRLNRDHDLGLIVVDNLQMMRGIANKEVRAHEVSAILRSLKALAKELNIPIIVLSQLNSGESDRIGKRPVISDLREFGSIEQYADLIMFIYCQEYYERENCPKDKKGISEIIVAKNRKGPTGTMTLKFFGEYSRFDNLSKEVVWGFE